MEEQQMAIRTTKLVATTLGSLVIVTAAGCGGPVDVHVGSSKAAFTGPGPCPMGDEILTDEVLTEASIPGLSDLDRRQIIAAVHESSHTDVVTIEEAFDRVDEGLINRFVLRDSYTNQFYVEIEYGAGENSYGAYLYWGTAVVAAAIHDGFPEECGPAVFNYDQGDVAPQCQGFLDYTNTATFAQLDAYLPSNVAQAIVDARASQPFSSVGSVVAVNGVAEARLQQILAAARTAGSVGASCSGIYDQVAVSTVEATAIVDFVNQASQEEIQGVLSILIDETVVDALITARPFAGVSAVSEAYRVGPATFRTLRNAATSWGPFEQLASAVNQIDHPDAQLRLDQHFDWRPLLATTQNDGVTSMECFGIAPALLPPEATIRPTLADDDEVLGAVTDAVSTANQSDELSVDPTPGLTDLEARTAGQTFFGCFINYHPNPWQYDSKTFFVDDETGASILIDKHYVE
jgi:DNA uptake protein ComE-like DNA-binding protein